MSRNKLLREMNKSLEGNVNTNTQESAANLVGPVPADSGTTAGGSSGPAKEVASEMVIDGGDNKINDVQK